MSSCCSIRVVKRSISLIQNATVLRAHFSRALNGKSARVSIYSSTRATRFSLRLNRPELSSF